MRVSQLRIKCNKNKELKNKSKEFNLAKELGLLEKESVISELLKISKILKDNGVNLSTLQLSREENGKLIYFKLSELHQKGVDIAKIIEENDLNGNFLYGKKVRVLRRTYSGNGRYKLTLEDIKLAKELGLIRITRTRYW